MCGARSWCLVAGLATVLAWALPAAAQQRDPAWTIVGYVQQSFPKQTNTNKQIDEINQMFATDFDTWDDIVNLSVGLQVHRHVSPRWLVGGEVDFSTGSIDGRATVPTEAGAADLAFEQEYSVYANVMLAARYFPCDACRQWRPFVYGAAGAAYEKDTTTLTLRNQYLDEGLRVENDGWFPAWTVGVGVDWHAFRNPDWFLELGVAYYWGRLDHTVPAQGSLAPAPEVRADTDSTGPNWWIGVGRSF